MDFSFDHVVKDFFSSRVIIQEKLVAYFLVLGVGFLSSPDVIWLALCLPTLFSFWTSLILLSFCSTSQSLLPAIYFFQQFAHSKSLEQSSIYGLFVTIFDIFLAGRIGF